MCTNIEISLFRGKSEQLYRIIIDLKFCIYHPKLVHVLRHAGGPVQRVYSEEMLIRHEADSEFLLRIVWFKEATFKMNGLVNSWNYIYWSNENPHEIITQELNLSRVTCYSGIWSGGMLTPTSLIALS